MNVHGILDKEVVVIEVSSSKNPETKTNPTRKKAEEMDCL
jgi:hypothetical protein